MNFNIGEIDAICERAEFMVENSKNQNIRFAAMELHIAALKLGLELRKEEVVRLKGERDAITN